MTHISQDEVRHVAKLARLHLKDEEVEKFTKQLSGVFDYIDVLNEVDTENVEPTSQLTGLTNVTREDRAERFCEPSELLKCSPQPIERNQIKVKPVL